MPMEKSKWFFNPITIFGLSIVALVTSLILFIYWYIEASTGLKSLISRFELEQGQFLEAPPWFVIMVLSLLVLIILIGIFLSFLYYLKTLQLYRLQNNFINNFTHELKTPVTSMKLYLETFLKHNLTRSDQEKYLEYMIQDVERLSDNITSILNLGKIESKRYEGDFSNENIIDVLNNFLKNNDRFFKKCNITIHNDSKKLIFCRINLPLFEILVMNLITNAIKYNKSDLAEINIRLKFKKNKLHIHFIDNGIGLEKKDIKKIFKKFYQVGNSENMSARGSGLGLYIVHNIARIHKWRINVKSRGVDKGSDFIITIPVLTNIARKSEPNGKIV